MLLLLMLKVRYWHLLVECSDPCSVSASTTSNDSGVEGTRGGREGRDDRGSSGCSSGSVVGRAVT